MLEKALKGSKAYYVWVLILLGVIAYGFFFYMRQLVFGLGVTGMSRDVSWGFYIAQFTFLVGIAASAVMFAPFWSSQASAMCVREAACFRAISATRSTISRSASAVESYLLLAIRSVSERSVLSAVQSRVSLPDASGL